LEATYKIEPVTSPTSVETAHASLLFSWGENLQAFALREGQSFVVGRAEPANWVLEDRSLSRTHARLSMRDGEVTLEDLGATNGCLLNGARVQTARLNEGDVAQLGALELRIATHTRLPTHAETLAHAAFLRLVTDELERARVFGRALSVLALKHAPGAITPAELRRGLKPLDRLCAYAPSVTLILLLEQDAVAARAWLDGLEPRARATLKTGMATFPTLALSAEALISRALDACHSVPPGRVLEAEPSERDGADGPILISPCMLRLYDLVARAARTPLPALIQGETGTGKELVARALHEKSPRAKGPFKALNCATIPTHLIESVLFGHERGAFTGADRQVQGVFEQAQGGTVFLDEVGELSAHAQAALLRVLEHRRVVRVGGTKEIDIDARIVAATHRDLAGMVQAGTFRQDLMFRLDALALRVPPLRERPDEISELASHFLKRAQQQWAVTAERLSEDATEALLSYAWPGNVRQLKNVIERAAVVCRGDTVELEDLPHQIWMDVDRALPAPVSDRAGTRPEGYRSLPDRVREFEIAIIREALDKAQGNQAQAARMLGVPRRTLANKVHAYELVSARAASAPGD
jgi:DNA-binding NtrC family response regulator